MSISNFSRVILGNEISLESYVHVNEMKITFFGGHVLDLQHNVY